MAKQFKSQAPQQVQIQPAQGIPSIDTAKISSALSSFAQQKLGRELQEAEVSAGQAGTTIGGLAQAIQKEQQDQQMAVPESPEMVARKLQMEQSFLNPQIANAYNQSLRKVYVDKAVVDMQSSLDGWRNQVLAGEMGMTEYQSLAQGMVTTELAAMDKSLEGDDVSRAYAAEQFAAMQKRADQAYANTHREYTNQQLTILRDAQVMSVERFAGQQRQQMLETPYDMPLDGAVSIADALTGSVASMIDNSPDLLAGKQTSMKMGDRRDMIKNLITWGKNAIESGKAKFSYDDLRKMVNEGTKTGKIDAAWEDQYLAQIKEGEDGHGRQTDWMYLEWKRVYNNMLKGKPLQRNWTADRWYRLGQAILARGDISETKLYTVTNGNPIGKILGEQELVRNMQRLSLAELKDKSTATRLLRLWSGNDDFTASDEESDALQAILDNELERRKKFRDKKGDYAYDLEDEDIDTIDARIAKEVEDERNPSGITEGRVDYAPGDTYAARIQKEASMYVKWREKNKKAYDVPMDQIDVVPPTYLEQRMDKLDRLLRIENNPAAAVTELLKLTDSVGHAYPLEVDELFDMISNSKYSEYADSLRMVWLAETQGFGAAAGVDILTGERPHEWIPFMNVDTTEQMAVGEYIQKYSLLTANVDSDLKKTALPFLDEGYATMMSTGDFADKIGAVASHMDERNAMASLVKPMFYNRALELMAQGKSSTTAATIATGEIKAVFQAIPEPEVYDNGTKVIFPDWVDKTAVRRVMDVAASQVIDPVVEEMLFQASEATGMSVDDIVSKLKPVTRGGKVFLRFGNDDVFGVLRVYGDETDLIGQPYVIGDATIADFIPSEDGE